MPASRTNSLLLQREWNQYQAEAWVGMISTVPGSVFISRPIGVPTNNGVKPRPGYPVYFDRTTNRYQVPINAEQIRQICGVVAYRGSDIAEAGVIEYEDGDRPDILLRGGIWVQAGASLQATDLLTWDHSEKKWIKGSRPTIDAASAGNPTDAELNALISGLSFTSIINFSQVTVGDGQLIEAYLPGGAI